MRLSVKIGCVAACALLLGACSRKTGAPAFASLADLQAAAEKGGSGAQFELGALYHDGGDGVTKDLSKARDLFQKSAAQGDVRAQFNLGVMYYLGEGIKQNYALAREWFEKATAQGNVRAQFNLGVMEYRGEGKTQNYARAIDLFTRAAVQGFHEAQFNLGIMSAKGEGMPEDIGKAYAWFTVAKESGNLNAAEAIANIERSLTADQLKIAKSMAAALKKELASVRAKAQAK